MSMLINPNYIEIVNNMQIIYFSFIMTQTMLF